MPDAATDTVKVYDPAIDNDTPVGEIDGGRLPAGTSSRCATPPSPSTASAARSTSPTTSSPPTPSSPRRRSTSSTPPAPTRATSNTTSSTPCPPGLAVDNSPAATQGRVYVTSGNTEQAGVYAYPANAATKAVPLAPTVPLAMRATGEGAITSELAGVRCDAICEAPVRSGAQVTLSARPEEGSAFTGWSGGGCEGTGECTVQMSEARSVSAEFEAIAGPPAPPAASASEIAQKGTLRINVDGKLAPHKLPRTGVAPIAVSVGGKISTTDASLPPQLKTLRIELNRHGRIDYAGLPTCVYARIQPGSSSRALAACRSSLVGQGSFSANITLAGQEPYPTAGRLLLFNGIRAGKPVLYGHIYAARPFATSFVIVFSVHRIGKGIYGTALDAPLPRSMDAWGRLTGLEMTLSRRYSYAGRRHSYISSGCPAPKGFGGAVFPLARTSFTFAEGKTLTSVFTDTCKVRG